MGLDISVGNPCAGLDPEGEQRYRRRFEELSRVCAAKGVHWTPPEGESFCGPVSSFSYSCMQYLRRAYALDAEEQPVTPVSGDDDLRRADTYVDDATSMFVSHLLCHSVTDGYYLPVGFADPLFLPEGAGVDSVGIVGSSQMLLRELVGVAPVIGVRLTADDALTDDEAARLSANSGDPFEVEQLVWLALYRACRASIASGHAIVFH